MSVFVSSRSERLRRGLFVSSMTRFPSASRRPGHFSLLVQREVTKRKDAPVARFLHILCRKCAWGLRRSVDGPSLARRQTGRLPGGHPSGFFLRPPAAPHGTRGARTRHPAWTLLLVVGAHPVRDLVAGVAHQWAPTEERQRAARLLGAPWRARGSSGSPLERRVACEKAPQGWRTGSAPVRRQGRMPCRRTPQAARNPRHGRHNHPRRRRSGRQQRNIATLRSPTSGLLQKRGK
jgi:hypothetical protein